MDGLLLLLLIIPTIKRRRSPEILCDGIPGQLEHFTIAQMLLHHKWQVASQNSYCVVTARYE